jgi:hypothetical protein
MMSAVARFNVSGQRSITWPGVKAGQLGKRTDGFLLLLARPESQAQRRSNLEPHEHKGIIENEDCAWLTQPTDDPPPHPLDLTDERHGPTSA